MYLDHRLTELVLGWRRGLTGTGTEIATGDAG